MLVSFEYAAVQAAAYQVQIKETETIGSYLTKAAAYYKIDLKKCKFTTSNGFTVTAGMTSAQFAAGKSTCGGRSAAAASSQKVVIKIEYSSTSVCR
ncbi:Oidioi.mRNA.OKI2018_I69.chr2.g7685.t1.cds [Oikopleura dioica]|uniref:Oidioi.mRNA.OKI2018_I69.chr2.g7685.t1.cds n=1 Tax=Oikopleura dioica TaxID=34765 RepID=A0ABN7T9C1_OIKDI|nr:Oidioi.mRNA.OKI2018_I69.chr2.g7685.t1.cds [Oikopleura dioica]